jgi:uncharacterized membrane protein YjfL (UPF0719 family)
MNEPIDKFILRMVFTLFICGILFLYKYSHSFLYPSSRQQMFKRFYPSKNSPDTLHLFSRLIGIGLIFSEFYFNMTGGIGMALSDFFIRAFSICLIYLLSIYIMESIVLYNFEYSDEIIKRKNFSYSMISFSHAIGLAYILKVVLNIAGASIPNLLFLWLFAMVLVGFATKTYSLVSKLSFNRLVVQKNIAVALSYSGFIWGWVLIISSSLDHALDDIPGYAIHVILKILLSLIIIPLFKFGLVWIYKLQDDLDGGTVDARKDSYEVELGYGVYEGAIFFTSCFLTTIITGQIDFGNFYPVF